MLSRRILRVKLMQTLFAYEHHKIANRQWALEQIYTAAPAEDDTKDQKSKQPSEKQKKEILRLLAKEPSQDLLNVVDDPIVKTGTKKALSLYKKYNKKNLTFLKRDLTTEVSTINYWYHSILGLLLAFAKVGKAYKKTNHSPFLNNAFIVALGNSQKLNKLIATNSVDWDSEKNQVLSWFQNVINTNPTYIEYIQSPNHDVDSQDKIIKHMVRRLILKGTVDDYFLKRDIRWFENQYIVKNMLEKTIKFFDPAIGKIEIPKLSLDWTTDRLFMNNLFDKTLHIETSKKELIAQNTKNWEVDRLPLIDRIILEMAITEMIQFPEIPIKVSINEYIEIAKRYSTDNSPQFVNGILDTLAIKLQKEGEIKKSGRGLIDNK